MAGEATSRTKARAAVVAIFLLGVGAGGLGMNLYQRTARPSNNGNRPSRMKMMQQRLNLTPEQATQVETILEETKNEYDQLKEDNRPRFDAIREKSRDRIRAALTAEQLPKYEEMVREFNERMQKRGWGRRGGDKDKTQQDGK
jgi:Spy/CpxP family protein refolding chaperone